MCQAQYYFSYKGWPYQNRNSNDEDQNFESNKRMREMDRYRKVVQDLNFFDFFK